MPTDHELADHDCGPASALARLARSRDPEAWADLLAGCGADIQAVARRLAGNAALADDAVQETLLQLRDQAGKFVTSEAAPDDAARRWILRVTANTTLQLLRSRKRALARDRAAGADHRQQTSAAEPHQHIERDETAASVRAALAELPETSRTPLVLHCVAGLGFSEIAAELRVPIGTAKTRVRRALEALRRRLKPLAGALSVAELSQRLVELPVPPVAGAPLGNHLLTAPATATVSGLPASGALAMTIKIALVCTATLAIGVLPMALSQETAPAPAAAGTGMGPGPQVAGDAVRAATLPRLPDALAKKITFDFQSTPLFDGVAFLAKTTAIPVLVHPDAIAANPPPLTLSVHDMSLYHALCWAARLSGTEWIYRDGAVLFMKADPKAATTPADRGFDLASIDGLWRKRILDQLEQQVTLDFNDCAVSEVMAFLRKITGVTIVMDPRLRDAPLAVTLKVDHMKLSNVIEITMKMSDTRHDLRDGALYVYAPTDAERAAERAQLVALDAVAPWRETMKMDLEKPLTMAVASTSFEDAVMQLREASGLNIVVETPSVSNGKTVTVNAVDLPTKEVLGSILTQAGCTYELRFHAVWVRPIVVVPDPAAATPAVVPASAPRDF
jgi:RNA polymerase sigma-70 factor, ECF subfamily